MSPAACLGTCRKRHFSSEQTHRLWEIERYDTSQNSCAIAFGDNDIGVKRYIINTERTHYTSALPLPGNAERANYEKTESWNIVSVSLHRALFRKSNQVLLLIIIVVFGILTTSLPDSIRTFERNLMLPGKM